MSFSSDLKEELSKISNLNKKDEVKYELIGYLISKNATVVKNKIAATKSKIRYAASKIASITSGICGL